MAFSVKTWINRLSEYPTRRALTKQDGTTEIVTVTRDEGQIQEPGTPLDAANLNDLESRINDAFTADGTAITALQTALQSVLGDFATVEPEATASKAYSIGEFLVWNDQLYKVTAAIAQGNALTVGGNIEATNVGAEISSSGSVELISYTEITQATTIPLSGAGRYKYLCMVFAADGNNGEAMMFPAGLVGLLGHVPFYSASKNGGMPSALSGYAYYIHGNIGLTYVRVSSVGVTGWTKVDLRVYGIK